MRTHDIGDRDGRDDLGEGDRETLVEAPPPFASDSLRSDVVETRVGLRMAGGA